MAVALTLLLKVPADALARSLPFSPAAVGEALAGQVQALAQRENLNYYPALAYCHGKGALEPDTLDALDSIAELAETLARNELRSKLRPFFWGVEFESVQPVAYTMPTARPKSPNGWWDLVEHLTPDRLKINLLLSLRGEEGVPEEATARRHVEEALADRFPRLEVTSARAV